MKHLAWLLVLLAPALAEAFGSYDDSVTRLEQVVDIQSWEDRADITISQTLRNDGAEPVTFSYLLPTFGVQTQPKTYWRSEGQNVESLPVDQAAQAAFDAAAASNQPAWIGALAEPFDAWWQVKNLTLKAGETQTLKHEFTQSLAYFEGFYLGELWLTDGQNTEALTVNFVRAGSPQHMLAWPGGWDSEKSGEAWAQQWQAENVTLGENLHFLSSDLPEPKLRYRHDGATYEASFRSLKSPEKKAITIIIDRSGSVYGPRWERLQLTLKTLLEGIPENQKILIGTLGSKLEWLGERQTNSREQQREWLATLSGLSAQSKTNYEALGSAFESGTTIENDTQTLVLLGDWSDFPKGIREDLARQPWPVLMIDFWQPASSDLADWWPRVGGAYVSLFNSGYDLVEEDLINVAWRNLGLGWLEDNAIDGGEWFGPPSVTKPYNQWAVGRVEPDAASAELADWLPRWWAGRKLGAYVREYQQYGTLSDDAQAAVLAIANTFGLAPAGVTGTASPEAFMDQLKSLSWDERWTALEALESGVAMTNGIMLDGAVPYYQVGETWQRFGWADFPRQGDGPKIKPWSDAHKALFVAHPQLLARPLSLGLVQLCAGQRCAEITTAGRSEPAATDTILWDQTAINHWATGYWADLVWANVVPAENNDPSQWARVVTRGEFVEWLVKYTAPEAILPSVDNQVFSDITPNQIGASEALWLQTQGVLEGYGDGTARLTQPLKRIEALKLLMVARNLEARYVLGNADDKMPFSDLEGWTRPWGYGAYLSGLVQGYDDNTFRPFQNLNQAEAFKLLVESVKLEP